MELWAELMPEKKVKKNPGNSRFPTSGGGTTQNWVRKAVGSWNSLGRGGGKEWGVAGVAHEEELTIMLLNQCFSLAQLWTRILHYNI